MADVSMSRLEAHLPAEEVAERTIEREAVVRLSAEDQRRFADAILHPPAPNAALRRAARRHRRLFGS